MIRRLLCLLPIAVLMLAAAAPASAFEHVGQYGVGFPATGTGQLVQPAGVGVTPDGTVVVSDIGAMRISVFDQSGRFLRAFGKNVSIGGGEGPEVCTSDCQVGAPGTAAGELTVPWGIAVGGDQIYVAEQGNNRVSVFNLQGQFLRAFGANVGGPGINQCTSACQAGTAGSAGGQMAGPSGVALGPDGKLYVGEAGTQRIDVFDSQSGQFERAFGKDVGGPGVNTCTTACQPGTADKSPGSLNLPFSLTFGPGGELYVDELGANRFSVFTRDGQFVRAAGSEGEAAGQLKAPYGVAVDAAGNTYVADAGNNRLDVFDPAGGFLRAYGRDVVPGAPQAPEVCTTVCQAALSGFGIGEFTAPFAVAVDCRGAVYVGIVGRVDKWGEPGSRVPPCPSNAFTIGAKKRNKKKGTLTVDVTLPGPGTLVADAGKKLRATAPQPTAAGTVQVTLKAAGKGVKALSRKGRLKGALSLTFTPPNGDPNTQSTPVQLVKKLKKHKRRKKGKVRGGKHGR